MNQTAEKLWMAIVTGVLASQCWAGYEGSGGSDTYYGYQAGASNTTGTGNVFLGTDAGYSNVAGEQNTFVGALAGFYNTATNNTFLGFAAGFQTTSGNLNVAVGASSAGSNTTGVANVSVGAGAGGANTTGIANVYVGYNAGANNIGSRNVFIGHSAGLGEASASNRLYIDNCYAGGGACSSPLIYGEFDNFHLRFNGTTEIHANGAAKSQMNFSQSSTDTGGWLTSVLDNNFFVSSGARYDGTSGGWMQRSPDNNAVIAGSGGLGYRIFTDSGHTVGSNFTPTVRLHIDYAGNLGLNTLAVAGTPIMHSSGAHLTAGGVWTDASSREYKEHIEPLDTDDALLALAELTPVRYDYKVDPQEKHVGFIAEDVPELVARRDRKSLSPMDIVAVLTKVLQEKSRIVDDQRAVIARQQSMLESIEARLAKLEQGAPGRKQDARRLR